MVPKKFYKIDIRDRCFKTFYSGNLPTPFNSNTVILCYEAILPWKLLWNSSKLLRYFNHWKSRVKNRSWLFKPAKQHLVTFILTRHKLGHFVLSEKSFFSMNCLLFFNSFFIWLSKFNRTAHIRHQCKKTTVLSCHRCLINTGVGKMNKHLNID